MEFDNVQDLRKAADAYEKVSILYYATALNACYHADTLREIADRVEEDGPGPILVLAAQFKLKKLYKRLKKIRKEIEDTLR